MSASAFSMTSSPPRKPAPLYAPPPENRFARYLWSWRMNLSATFAAYMFEPWELYLMFAICMLITVTFWVSFFTYYPSHIAYLSRRFSYYVFDDETVDAGLVFRQWFSRQVGSLWDTLRGLGGVKEL